MKTLTKRSTVALALMVAFTPVALIAAEAVAYTIGTNTGTDALGSFETLLGTIMSWIEGPLGTLLAVVALGVGLAMGVMQQSIIAAVIGIFFAAVVSYGPNILLGVAGSAESAL
jgi:type IV secretory pathway VirB2 component (pilin)